MAKLQSKTLEQGIKEILENTIANKGSVLIRDIATLLNTTYDTISNRLRSNTELKALWEQAKPEIYVGKTSMGAVESAEYTQRIKEVLEGCVKSGEKTTLKEIASQLGINYSALQARVSKTPILKELMALQGCKHYFKVDSAVYVSNKGLTEYAQNYVNQLGADFKVMDLEDVIRNARKYSVNLDNLKDMPLNSGVSVSDYSNTWKLPSKLDSTLVNEWRALRPEVFEKRIVELFDSMGYAVTSPKKLNLRGFYLINKGDEKRVIKCHNKQTAPDIDIVRALYGLKDYFGADSVVMVAPFAITAKSKDFIDTINSSASNKNSYKLWNLDEVIDLYSKKFKK